VVLENPLPAKPVITGVAQYCEGENTTLSSSAGDHYIWSNGDTTQQITITEGSYHIKIKDLNGCESISSDTFTVTELPSPAKPIITADGPTTFWLGDSVVLESSEATTYLWSPGNETTRSITVTDSGSYSVTVWDANGCVSVPSDDVLVTVQSIEQPAITADGPVSFCEGSMVVLSSTAAYAYTWSNGEITQSITVSTSGDYSVVVYDEFGHKSRESEVIQVTVHTVPEASFIITDATCSGYNDGAISVTAQGGTPPYQYDWSNGNTTPDAQNLVAGSYQITISDVNDCMVDTAVSVTEPEDISIEFQSEMPYCPDSYDGMISATVTGGTLPYSLLWSNGETGYDLSGLGHGNYSLTVTDANSCQSEDEVNLTVIHEICITIPDIITPYNDDPFNDTWIIQGIEFYPDAVVEVFNRWGKRVFYSVGYDTEWDGTFNGEELPMDSYHYVIDLKNGKKPYIGNITIVK